MAIKKTAPVKESPGLDKLLWIVLAILAVWILFAYTGGGEDSQQSGEALAALRAELDSIDNELEREEEVRLFKLEKARNLYDKSIALAQNAIDSLDQDNLTELAEGILEKNRDAIDNAEIRFDTEKKEIQAKYAEAVEALEYRRDEIEAKIAELDSEDR